MSIQGLRYKATIVESMEYRNFIVKLENGDTIMTYLGGKMRRSSIKLCVGSQVKIEVNPNNPKQARIISPYFCTT